MARTARHQHTRPRGTKEIAGLRVHGPHTHAPSLTMHTRHNAGLLPSGTQYTHAKVCVHHEVRRSRIECVSDDVVPEREQLWL